MVVESVGQLLQGLEEAVEIHLIVVTPPHDVLVDDVVVCLQNVAVRQTRVLGQFLKLRAGDEVVTLVACQNFEHLLGIGVQVQILQTFFGGRQDSFEHADLIHLFLLILRQSGQLDHVGDQVGLHVLIQLRQSLLDISIWQLLVGVDVEGGIGIDLEQPGIHVLIDEDVQTQDLETARIVVVGADEAVVGILQIGLQRNYGFLGHLLDLPEQVVCVHASAGHGAHHRSKQLFARLVIVLELLSRGLELLAILVEREVSEVHVEVLDVALVWLLVVGGAEPSQTLICQEGLHWVHALYHHVDPAVELPLVQHQWVLDVSLHQELIVEGTLWQVRELFEKYNAISSTTSRRLGDEGLVRILAVVLLEVSDLVRQQEGVGHELVVNGEESLESTDDDAEDVLLGEVVHQRVPVEDALGHLYDVQVVVSKGHAVPQQVAIARLGGLAIAIFANHVLHGVQLTPAVVGIHHDLGSP